MTGLLALLVVLARVVEVVRVKERVVRKRVRFISSLSQGVSFLFECNEKGDVDLGDGG